MADSPLDAIVKLHMQAAALHDCLDRASDAERERIFETARVLTNRLNALIAELREMRRREDGHVEALIENEAHFHRKSQHQP